MFQRAVDLGLPASFVELRHEATHREPPSLVVLRKATQRSLEWLWDNYWAEIDDLGDVPQFEHDDPASIRAALGGVLRQLSSGSSSAEPAQKKRKRDHFDDSIASQLASICELCSEASHILPSLLLDELLLVNLERK